MKTWGEMTQDEKISLFTAYLDGKEIEAFSLKYRNDELVRVWHKTKFIKFHEDVPVRIKK